MKLSRAGRYENSGLVKQPGFVGQVLLGQAASRPGEERKEHSTVKAILFAAALAGICLGSAQSQPVADPAYRAIVQEAKAHVQEVDVQKFQALRKAHPDLIFIDVRESEEWASGHAAGALHISKGMLEHDIEAKVANKQATVVLYCHSGARSALAAENLMRMGYSNVYSLDGGFRAYQAAGLPVEK